MARAGVAWLLVLGAGFAPRLAPAQQQDSARAGVRAPSAPLTPAQRDAQARGATRPPAAAAKPGPPISPGTAFLYSFLVPGLGQARLDRPVAGALYASVEVLSIAMLRKTWFDEREARRFRFDSIPLSFKTDAAGNAVLDSLGFPVVASYAFNRFGGDLLGARKGNSEDWVALLIFNHLFSGADAYVAAQLWDLPANVAIRWLPGGPVVQAALRWRW
ncbi:MAG: hypothetical protein HYX65_06825 [Gemmatimonadetes bacterium]|nr:hypothetical protein [Gemmatimonadota bacterium]